MTVLVTGSSGHLGTALMRLLGPEGRGADLLPGPDTHVVGDLADRAVARRALAGVDAVIHTATLHKPHIGSHARADFIAANLTATLNLLEEAAGLSRFIFTSTTSAFGRALRPGPGEPAAWITEDVVPRPRNIYGATKTAAEDLCELIHRDHGLPVLILRTSRFFPEPDDRDEVRAAFDDLNLKVNELLYRRVDLEDAARAHLDALERAPALGFGRYIISATTPFAPQDAAELHTDAPAVVARLFPHYEQLYAQRGWTMLPAIERVYDNARARRDLGWEPRLDFGSALERLARGEDPRSDLARAVGARGYHAQSTGVYTSRP